MVDRLEAVVDKYAGNSLVVAEIVAVETVPDKMVVDGMIDVDSVVAVVLAQPAAELQIENFFS